MVLLNETMPWSYAIVIRIFKFYSLNFKFYYFLILHGNCLGQICLDLLYTSLINLLISSYPHILSCLM